MQDITPYEVPAIAEAQAQEAAVVDALFLATWLHGKAEKTQEAYSADMQRFYHLIGKPLREVTLADVQRYQDSLLTLKPAARNRKQRDDESIKPATRARMMAAVKSALTFAQKTGYLAVNVGAAVRLPRLEDTLAERIMSEPSVARMLALETSTRNHAILVLLYRGGLRVSELCNLTWRNLQERDQAGQVSVFGKGRKTRFVLLDETTWQEVIALKSTQAGPDDYVFQSRQSRSRAAKASRRLDESTIDRIVGAAGRRAGIPGKVSAHWMRHAHATHALGNQAPISLVAATLGHRDIKTTARYTHVQPDASSAQYLKV